MIDMETWAKVLHDDPDKWPMFDDWLQEQGHPLGFLPKAHHQSGSRSSYPKEVLKRRGLTPTHEPLVNHVLHPHDAIGIYFLHPTDTDEGGNPKSIFRFHQFPSPQEADEAVERLRAAGLKVME